MDFGKLAESAKLIRTYILEATTHAGSGHPTSSLSAADLMTGLFFGGIYRFDAKRSDHPNNDRLVFSKGHASPLLYALWAAAGELTESDMMTYRTFGSSLEGHPTVAFPYAEAATGSLGQGLSIGVGIALNAKYLDKLPYKTYVLLGDSEMAEGSCWEALQIAAHYKLDNLIGVLDVNRLGQRGETMYGADVEAYRKRVTSFGWETMVIDGHSFESVIQAYQRALEATRPVMIIARTVKGKGVSFVEDKNGWHGKALGKEELARALEGLGAADKSLKVELERPDELQPEKPRSATAKPGPVDYPSDTPVATRDAYGKGLVRIAEVYSDIVSLDGEVSNSTRAARFKEKFPERFFEMYIAEQNMVGAALGLSTRGKTPFVSSFAAFLTRAFDQIRMSQYSGANINFVGSHAGVSIGMDGPSQMGLEDIAMFRTILGGVVLYPSDAVSADKLVEACAGHPGICYLRTTRMKTPVIYGPEEKFVIGGCKVLRKSDKDTVTVVGAGVTLHEALVAHELLRKEGIAVRVIDLYSIKPLDELILKQAAEETKAVLTVEDHYPEGGLGEAVRTTLAGESVPVFSLAVRLKPKSGKPVELLDFEAISANAIVDMVKELA